MALYNRVKVAISAGGTGNLTLGAPASMFRGFSDAGVPTGAVVSYVIEDATGAKWEYGRGTYTAPSTFARTTVLATSAGNTTPINAATTAFLFIDALAEDFAAGISVGSAITGGTTGRVLFDNGGAIGEAANLTYDGTATSARQLKITGATSGAVTLQAQGAAGTYSLTLPNALATVNGQSLTSDTAGNLSWTTEVPANMTFAATSRVLGRNTAGAGAGEELTASQVLDWLGATQGQVLYRSSAGWTALATGAAGQYLQTAGAGANPVWASLPTYGVTVFSTSSTYNAGDIVTNGGKIYSAKAAISPAGPFNATQWTEIGGSISAATAAVLGGVFATPRPVATAGRFVAGITATGALDYQRVNLGADVDGTLPVTNGGTGTATAFTQGSVVFAGASGVFSQNNAQLFWDNTNNRLGVGTAAVGAKIHALQNGSACIIAATSDTEGKFSAYNNSATNPSQGHFSALPGKVAFNYKGATGVDTPLVFQSVDVDRIWMSATGQLGIGVAPISTDPLLTVAGNIRLTVAQSWTTAHRGTPVAGTGAFDFAAANNFTIAGAGAAVTVANPTNVVAGQSGAIVIDNALSVAFGTNFKWEGGTAPTGSGAGKKDILIYYVIDATNIAARLIKGVA